MIGSEDEHTQVFRVLDLVLEVNNLKQQLADKDKILSNLVTSLQNCKDCRFEPDKIICITERAIHQAALERQKGSE